MESDPAWIVKLRGLPDVAQAETTGRLRFVHATGDYGMPLDASAQARWQTVWTDPATVEADLVLVDGRFRVACALEVLARCRPHTVLLFHDFWNRAPYHPVLAFTDWLGSCDSLAILRRKAVIDPTHFESVRRLYRLDPQ